MNYMELLELLATSSARMFTMNFLRYFIPAGLVFFMFWVLFKDRFMHRFIQKKFPKTASIWFELKYSISTLLILTLVGLTLVVANEYGLLKLYRDIDTYGWGYAIFSMVFLIFFQDLYAYWTHRWMHHPRIYKYVHKVHHKSTNPSPWAAYSFHPWEALINVMMVPIILFTMPMHQGLFFVFAIFIMARNVMAHMGFELLPKGFTKSKWLSWSTTTTHHSMHHQFFHCNYGFYFSWWDDWMKTTHKHYEEHYEEVTNRPRQEVE